MRIVVLTAFIPVTLDIPIGVRIIWVVLLRARHLNLLEPPLGQVLVRSAEVASQMIVSEPQTRRKRMDTRNMILLSLLEIVNDLDLPVVMEIANRRVPVARHLVVELRDRRGNVMGVQVARGGTMLQANHISILQIPKFAVEIKSGLVPSRVNNPLIVAVLVMIASDLLLIGAHRERLNMRVQ